MAILWIYLATIVEKIEYGELSYLISIATIGQAAASLGLGRTIIVYNSKKENISSPAFTLGIISASIASIITYVITQNISVSVFLFGMMIFYLVTSDLVSGKHYTVFSKYKLLRSALSVFLALFFYYIFGINGIVLGFGLATFPTFIGVYKYIKNEKIGLSILKSKIGFMINNLLNELSQRLFWWGDKLIIANLIGFTTLGSYQLASQYLILLYSIPYAIFLYLLPQESEGIHNKKLKIYLVGLSGILVLISIIILPSIIDIILPDYHEIILPIQIMSVGIIFITISMVQEARFLSIEKSKWVIMGSGFQVGTYFLLIMFLSVEYGLIGLSIAFLLSTITRVVFNTGIISFISKNL